MAGCWPIDVAPKLALRVAPQDKPEEDSEQTPGNKTEGRAYAAAQAGKARRGGRRSARRRPGPGPGGAGEGASCQAGAPARRPKNSHGIRREPHERANGKGGAKPSWFSVGSLFMATQPFLGAGSVPPTFHACGATLLTGQRPDGELPSTVAASRGQLGTRRA
jgi:hypothetical protein